MMMASDVAAVNSDLLGENFGLIRRVLLLHGEFLAILTQDRTFPFTQLANHFTRFSLLHNAARFKTEDEYKG